MTVGWNANGPDLYVEIGVTSSASSALYTWDVAVWDSALWGPDVVWQDITSYVRELTINRGKSRATEQFRYSVGTFSAILDNRDDRFSPANTTGPYATGGVSQIRPRVPFRVYHRLHLYPSGSYIFHKPIFYGYIDVWQDQFPGGGVDATTYIEGTDVLSVLASFNGPEQSSAGAGEAMYARMIRILENVGFTGFLEADVGGVSLQATTLAQNALTEATLTVDTENGTMWGARENGIILKSSDSVLSTLAATPYYTFGPGAGEVPYADPQFIYDSDQIHNVVSLARVGGTQQTASDPESRALYGDRAYSRNDLIAENDVDVLAVAELFLSRFRSPEYRVSAVTVYPMADTAQPTTFAQLEATTWYRVLAYDLFTPVRVKATTPGGTAVDSYAYIDGITHVIRPRSWVTTFNFASAEVFRDFALSYWDTGTWDDARWFFGV